LGRYLNDLRLPLLGRVTLALLQSVSLLPIAWLVRRAFDSIIPSQNVAGLVLLGLEISVPDRPATLMITQNRNVAEGITRR
jgi:hypothetical protein